MIIQNGIANFNADITFDSTYLSANFDPMKVTVYSRDFENRGTFFPLTTSYNSALKQWNVTTTKFGEFIFALARPLVAPGVPIPFKPAQNSLVDQTVPVEIAFSSMGITTGFHLQVANDSLFANLAVNDSTLESGVYILTNPLAGSPYFTASKVRTISDGAHGQR